MHGKFRKTMFVVATLAVVICAGWSVSRSEEDDAGLSATIKGTVEAGEFDDDGNVLSVYVWDAEYGDVLISREMRGRELLKLEGSVIEATGDLRPLDDEAGFDYVMNVESYEVLEPEGEEED